MLADGFKPLPTLPERDVEEIAESPEAAADIGEWFVLFEAESSKSWKSSKRPVWPLRHWKEQLPAPPSSDAVPGQKSQPDKPVVV